ncbi:hypothetical protein GCM10022409_03470 [Hymenobacter glaciei]|uniref:Uncharacterized protein n=1 Tax=Hymenobacter glaciei TaxID=877209 RepID=A0ABP7T9E2_9BACT
MAAEDSSSASDSVSDEELLALWRVRWKSSIEELTSLDHQRKTWLDAEKPSVHYTFVEFMCCYFDDLLCGMSYNQLVENGYVSEQEMGALFEWHTTLDSYNSPGNNDYDDVAILNDLEWIRIASLGAVAWEKLQLLWSSDECAV